MGPRFPVDISIVWPLLLLIFSSGLAVGIYGKVCAQKRDPREPPVISSRIPLVGHLIGMIRHGTKHFAMVNKANHPIFTLPTLNSQAYVVTSPTLAAHIQRNSKTLAFYPIIMEVTRRLIAFDKDAARIGNEQGPDSLMAATHVMMINFLGPGPSLDSMTTIQLEQFSIMLNETASDAPVEIHLYEWAQHIFTLCNAYAVYGPENIFAMHPELERAFWDFEDGMLGLVVDIIPSITAHKANRAREEVLWGLREYVEKERYKKASTLIQTRIRTNLSHGISKKMAGNGELILMFGILGNAVPTTFWLVAHIFSRPILLQQIRDELESALELRTLSSLDKEEEQEHVQTISAATVKACPLLYSCYRETLRDVANLTSARWVLSDTLLAEQYLLRKDSVIQIPSEALHKDTSIWGPDAGTFKAERFLAAPAERPKTTSNEPESSEQRAQKREAMQLPKGVPSAAFRAFGGGNVLCPGRHFAQSEITTFVALLVLGFEITGSDGGPLQLPSKDDTRIPLSVMKPVNDPWVKIQRREGFETVRWALKL